MAANLLAETAETGNRTEEEGIHSHKRNEVATSAVASGEMSLEVKEMFIGIGEMVTVRKE